jgi:hypothetical protein
MGYYDWDFHKLPAEDYDKVFDAVKNRDIVTLTLIHNKYKLSNNIYCCPKDFIIIFYEDAINKNYFAKKD